MIKRLKAAVPWIELFDVRNVSGDLREKCGGYYTAILDGFLTYLSRRLGLVRKAQKLGQRSLINWWSSLLRCCAAR